MRKDIETTKMCGIEQNSMVDVCKSTPLSTVKMAALSRVAVSERSTRNMRKPADSIEAALQQACLPPVGTIIISPEGRRCWIAGRSSRDPNKVVLVSHDGAHTVRDIHPDALRGYCTQTGAPL